MFRYVLLAACFFGATNAATTTTWFPDLCPFFDLGLCYASADMCYPAVDVLGCPYCLCDGDAPLQDLLVSIIMHLINTSISNDVDLMNQITLFAALIDQTLQAKYAADVATYSSFYKRALRDIRSAKKSYLPEKARA